MTQTAVEIIGLLMLATAWIYLWFLSLKTKVNNYEGCTWVFIGLGLVFGGNLIDIVEDFPNLADYMAFRTVTTDSLFKHLLCYLPGFMLIMLGLSKFVRSLSKLAETEQKLREGEEKYRTLIETMNEGFGIINENGVFTYANDKLSQVLGYPKGELVGVNAEKFYKDPSVLDRLIGERPGEEANVFEADMVCKGGRIVTMMTAVKLTTDSYGAFMGGFAVFTDITERIEAERELCRTKERFQELAELLPQFVYEIDRSGKLTFLNRYGMEAGGYASGEFPWESRANQFIPPEEQEKAVSLANRVLAGQKIVGEELRVLPKNGKIFPMSIYANPIVSNGDVIGARGVGIDVSALKSAQQRIEAELEENKVLLSEVHHRVKNNLQIMASLLALQAAQTEEETCRVILNEAQSRLLSIALVHENLYQSGGLAKIRMKDQIPNLMHALRRTLGPLEERVSVSVDVDDIVLDIGTAVPVALIVNELVSNCFKHAFPGGRKGKIGLSFRSIGETQYELEVVDNGVGLNRNLESREKGSFGLKLVNSLAEQLHGELTIHCTDGTGVRVTVQHISQGRKGVSPHERRERSHSRRRANNGRTSAIDLA